jgi:transposase
LKGVEMLKAMKSRIYPSKSQKQLKKLQRGLSKKKKGSKNRQKVKLRVQKLHSKINNQRKECPHKISNEITNQYNIRKFNCLVVVKQNMIEI